jgi:hypothetical protein
MKDTSGRDDAVRAAAVELAQKLHARLRAIEQFTGYTYPNVRGDLQKKALALVTYLDRRHTEDDPLMDERAREMCRLMFGGDKHPPIEFWATKLGTDVAWAIGYPLEEVTPTIAAAVLRCSRQMVWKLTKQGTLPLTPELLRGHLRGSDRWQQLQPVGVG